MSDSPVRWVSAFLDTPEDQVGLASGFWTAVTETVVGAALGDHGEFLPLDPTTGDTCLWVQRIQDGPVSAHPDLYVEDVDDVAARAVELGASVLSSSAGLAVLTSPGGLPFCLVAHRGQSVRPEPVGPMGARSVVDQICVDIPPSRWDTECVFWASLTGWQRTDDPSREFGRLVRPSGIPYAFLLQRLDDERAAVGIHLDLACDDREAECARQQALGADLVRRTDGWTVMRDPTGRTYCTTGRAPGDV
jgi:hypothetical protein